MTAPDQQSQRAGSPDMHFAGVRPDPAGPETNVLPQMPPAPAPPTVTAAGQAAQPQPPGAPLGRPVGPPPPVRRPSKGSGNARRGPRRARLQLRGINVWSALRFSVVIAIALFCVWMVMVGVLYGILDGAGAISKVNEAIVKVNPDGPANIVTPKMVFGGGVIIGAVYMVLFIAISTIGTVIYNLCADLVGGVELTLSERE
jgi:hypothetical protein